MMPASLEYIGPSAFRNCVFLAAITFPANCSLKTIETEAFSSCTALTVVDLSNTKVEVLGGSAFAYSSSVANVILPGTIKTINGHALNNLQAGVTFTVHAVEPPILTYNYSIQVAANSGTIHVPAASVTAYQAAPFWTTRTIIAIP